MGVRPIWESLPGTFLAKKFNNYGLRWTLHAPAVPAQQEALRRADVPHVRGEDGHLEENLVDAHHLVEVALRVA